MSKTTGRKAATAKILATVVLVGGAAGVAGLGTFGAFTSTTQAEQSVASGTVNLTLNGQKSVEFTTVEGMAPGDSFQRPIHLARGAGDEQFGSLIITPTTSGNADLVKALDVDVKTCSVPWTANGTTLECTGTAGSIGTVLDVNRAITVPGSLLSDNLNSTAGQLYAAATFRFTDQGAAVDNTLQNATAKLRFTFTATQRSGKAL